MNRMECVRMNMEEDNGRKVRRSSKRSRMRIEGVWEQREE